MKTFRVDSFGTIALLQSTLDGLPMHISSVEEEPSGTALVHTNNPGFIEYAFRNQGYARIIEEVEQ